MAADNTDGQCRGSEHTAQCFQKIAVRQLGNMAAIGMRHEITMSEMQHNEAAQAMLQSNNNQLFVSKHSATSSEHDKVKTLRINAASTASCQPAQAAHFTNMTQQLF